MSRGLSIFFVCVSLITFCSADSLLQPGDTTPPKLWADWFCPSVPHYEVPSERKCYKFLAANASFEKAALGCAALKEDTDLFTPTVIYINDEWEGFDAGVAGIILESQGQKTKTSFWTGDTQFVANLTPSGFGNCYEYHVESTPFFTSFSYEIAPCSKENAVLCQTYPYKVMDLLKRLTKFENRLDTSVLNILKKF